ncbi:traB family protein [Yersinia ruckeri]|uniref:TraB/GumN family protein n=1 Tax=Yersinia ruckeri TaxID=29486 RepID=UPI0005AC3D62|nr:TraB/GumN family protein [Yersinia ruckeri]AJI94245.1 traB family protein [Yersinia ruckeri]MCW6567702.1 TraB/GumN family protein [Yersinia ruckeri]
MGQLLRQLATLLGIISPPSYPYPGLDLQLSGERYFHLVGSIHMGTEGMFPLPDILLDRLIKADALIVEADITVASSPFGQYPDEVPLMDRLSEQCYQQFLQRSEELKCDPLDLASLPAWQVALMLQARQAQNLGLRGEYGIDYQLLNAAKAQSKSIIELEGAQMQLSLLESLSDSGMTLLEDTLAHWHTNARMLQTMISWWLERQPCDQITTLSTTFSNDLYEILMVKRNQLWKKRLEALPAGRYVVAVGALHLYGEGNLPTLMRSAH